MFISLYRVTLGNMGMMCCTFMVITGMQFGCFGVMFGCLHMLFGSLFMMFLLLNFTGLFFYQ
ncbi:hypothetical protein KEF85_08315 [Methylomonas paludis]|uniref:Uncharacterized protein n=1 Tax=Methylomonas paludis TaxID=1173101 RepID=A0A975MR23_9GAMM|nr:hypothetical protein [Methylomonas paludis]QWF72432.1 hypothetical protein KEF85_08315 [Methylomonas paludis]